MEKALHRDREWLNHHYNTLRLSTYELARLAEVDPKTAWTWLKKYGLNTRPRAWDNRPNPTRMYQDPEWLRREYVDRCRSTAAIGADFGLQAQTISYWLKRHGIPRRNAQEVRDTYTYRKLFGPENPMHGRQGAASVNWKGGTTPDRQALYNKQEWKDAVLLVWRRDDARCQRCATRREKRDDSYHVHHIRSFSTYPELRCDPSNLVLLCGPCHRWVHSRNNREGQFLEGGDANE
jgi:hypothetical protein